MDSGKRDRAAPRIEAPRLLARLAVSGALFGIVLLGSLEIALRAGGRYADRLLINTPPGPDGIAEFDPEVGHLLRPGYAGICRRSEFTYPVRSNALGLRDDEVPGEKGPGEARLLVLGDSIASGFGVVEEDRFTERLEAVLDGRAAERGGTVRVINAAVGGHGTWHQAILLRRLAERVRPDAVLLDFSSTNDFNNNVEFARWRRDGGRYYLFPEPASPLRAFLRDHLHAYHLLGSLRRWESGRGEVTPESRAETVQALEAIRETCRERGIPLTVAVMGTLDLLQAVGDPAMYHHAAYREAIGILEEGGYRFIDAVEPIRRDREFGRLFHPIDRHPNAAGHARLAEILLEHDILPRPAPLGAPAP